MIGRSGGRSAGNRTGKGAEFRATQRERDLLDPPPNARIPRPEDSIDWKLIAVIVGAVFSASMLASGVYDLIFR